MPFTFLAELQQRFTSLPSASSSDLSSAPAYALQGSFGPTIAQLMNTYNTAPPTDELTRAQTELAQVKDIMVQNVEQILSRGERIELLVDKTDNMASQATAFRRGARTVRRQMWWKNKRVLGLSVLVALVRRMIPSRRWSLCLCTPVGPRMDSRRPVLRRRLEPVRFQVRLSSHVLSVYIMIRYVLIRTLSNLRFTQWNRLTTPGRSNQDSCIIACARLFGHSRIYAYFQLSSLTNRG